MDVVDIFLPHRAQLLANVPGIPVTMHKYKALVGYCLGDIHGDLDHLTRHLVPDGLLFRFV